MNRSLPETIAIITGDPSLPDPTKLGHRYGPEDIAVHSAMREAFATRASMQFEVFERHETMFEALAAYAPQLVVNFCDTGFGNLPDREVHVVTQLECMNLPYTGAPPRAMLICFDKQIVRLVAAALGIAVANEDFIPRGQVADAVVTSFPALIKPNAADGSVGITKDAVVNNQSEARAYLQWLASELPDKDVLIQEYLPGPEFGLALLGNPNGGAGGLEALPMLEVDFSALPDDCAPILSFESKAQPDSPYWTEIRIRVASLSADRQRALAADCRRLFTRLGLRDYGRFDFRTAADGTIRLLEVNPNPAWGYDAKLAIMAGFAGWSYGELLERLVATAWSRVRSA